MLNSFENAKNAKAPRSKAWCGFSPDFQKKIFGFYPSGCCVITGASGGSIVGITVSSLVSVSLEPSLALFCIHEHSRRKELLLDSDELAVHWLAAKDSAVAECFAESARAGFDRYSYHFTDKGCPILDVAGPIAIGTISHVIKAGDHWVVFIDLDRGIYSKSIPAMYYQGSFEPFFLSERGCE